MGALKMNSINLILQAKNDVGKTYIASILAEYLQANDSEFRAYDTDNSKNSLAKFGRLKAEPIELLDKNPAAFEMAFGKFLNLVIAKNEGAVIDSGADIFEPIVQYFVENWDDNLIAENTKEIIFHTVIAGGDRLDDTINGLVTLCNKLPHKIKIVVWLNEYFGPIEVAGKPFEEFKIYDNNREKIHGIVKIRYQDSDFFKADLLKKNTLNMTLSEAIKSEEFSEVSSRRFEEFQRELFEQLDIIFTSPIAVKMKTEMQKIVENMDKKTAPKASENDALILGQTFNDKALAKYTNAINKAFEKHLDQLAAANAMHLSDANRCAEIVITQAAEYLTKRLNQSADEIFTSNSKMLAAHISEANNAASDAKNARNWAIIMACISIFMLLTMFSIKLFNWL